MIKDEIKFYEHQVAGIRRMWNMPSFLLADDMGLGKSMQSLTVFGVHANLRKKKYGIDSKLLVVCPVSLKENWSNEIEIFTRMGHVVVDGTPKKRTDQIMKFMEMEGTKVLIVNYEQVKAHMASLNTCQFDVIIADEAHYLKNPSSQRTQAFMKLRAERFFMLTGTPMMNNPSELWTILNRIQPGGWGTYWEFCQRYCRYGGYENKQILGPKNLNELTQDLNKIMIRRLKDEVLDLPKEQYIKRLCGLRPLQQKLYDKALQDLVLLDHNGEEKEIKGDLVKFLRLKQICGTTATVLEDGTDESAKLDLAEEDAETITQGGHKIIVFSQFRGVMAAYKARLEKRLPNVPVFEIHGGVPKEKRQGVVNAWSAVQGPAIVVCLIKVAGVGLNMTAARHLQFLDEDFTPGNNQQCVDRARRIGASETQAVQVYRYYVKDSAEDRVEVILRTKKNMFDQVVESDSYQKKIMAELMRDLKEKSKVAA
jgi:SNF2 family DNA or RNA helicase